MGDDAAIVQAARVSYGKGTKTPSDDRTLIRYLMRHRHCYRGDMQALTARGWKRWDELYPKEKLLVPDPETRTLRKETLEIEVFDSDEELISFENNRMSFHVTPDHRMWFKGKYRDEFDIVRAEEMSHWGHFDPLSGYELFGREGELDPRMQFVGFALGDGSFVNSGAVSFHLRKGRKKKYLRELIETLNLSTTTRTSSTYADAEVFYVKCSWLSDYAPKAISRDKKFTTSLDELKADEVRGLFDGLVNSDGSLKPDRKQIEFSSTSPHLIGLFQTLSAFLGLDAHLVGGGEAGTRTTAYFGQRTTLEARKQNFSRTQHTGKVYCATTSTGLLMVRGGADKFAFVCGNTTPFEMCELKLHVRVPMDCWRQWIRHRTASVNEYSTRYSEAIDDRQCTQPDEWRNQSKQNKQGSGWSFPQHAGTVLSDQEKELHEHTQRIYQDRLTKDVAREQARKDLPLSTYTEAYWKCNLHNLFHFLSLRMDVHAQKEIRDYADVIGNEIVAQWVPHAWEAFKDYRLEGMFLSGPEIAYISAYGVSGLGDQRNSDWLSKREFSELTNKVERLKPLT